MPFGTICLNDGAKIPAIGFGTGSVNKGQDITPYILNALEAGFVHLDTAENYRNEYSIGNALRQSGMKREEVFITSKYLLGGPVKAAVQRSLAQIGIEFLDLYLIHSPRLDVKKLWAEFEDLKEEGLVRSIGVSNFTITDLEALRETASVVPAVNQINFDLYQWRNNKDLLKYAREHGIVVAGYNCLSPLKHPGGPADAPITKVAKRLNVSTTQVTLAWAKSKGVVIITTSSKKERLEEYLSVGDLRSDVLINFSASLSPEDIASIDEAALKGLPLILAMREEFNDRMKGVLFALQDVQSWRMVLRTFAALGLLYALLSAFVRR
ncbi:Aldo/keto reductase [Flagelloscypha sp. PMI_526]|nr:Aldo/keto reductase [Flagelloscypha sp. PMI_526]